MDLKRLDQTLGRPELHWLIEKLVQRLERGHPLTGTVTLRQPKAAQREALAKLLGRSVRPGPAIAIRLAELEQLLQHAGLCTELREAVEAIAGPVIDRRKEALAASEAWSSLFRDAEESGLQADAQPWLEEMERSGLLRRLSRNNIQSAKLLLQQALNVASRLPAGGMPLAELAALSTGDSHALDLGCRLQPIVLRLVARIAGFDAIVNIEERRSAWASVGVLCDELSAPVLILNLCGSGDSVTDHAMRIHAGQGEPYRLSTRQLLRERLEFSQAIPRNTVFVCENPAVVAAAANRLGPRSAPLISIEGQPKTAAHLLLSKLRDAQVRMLYHGDFDWAGIRIGNLIHRRYGAEPWLFSSTEYASSPKGKRLHGRPCSADWDSGLMNLMLSEMKSVHEEAVMDSIISDLNCHT